MKFLKKYWYFIIITLVTAGLGAMTFITSQQLTKKTPVAPNVAQEKPKAAVAACTLTIVLATTGSPTPTLTGSPSPTPTSTPTGTLTSTPTNTPTPTAITSQALRLHQRQYLYLAVTTARTVNADCRSGLVCDGGPAAMKAVRKTNCSCDVAAMPPYAKTPVAGTGPSILGASVIGVAFLLILLGLAF